MMKYVFISYRRSDSSDITGRIFDRLKAKFGDDALFKDVDHIPIGKDFRTVISEAVGQCKVLLAIIGDDWLRVTDKSGGRRIDDPNDYVHIEIVTALKRGIPVVPILVENSAMPLLDELPEPLRELSFRHGMPVRPDPDFHNDMDRLCQQLANYVESSRWRRVVPYSSPRLSKFLPWFLGIAAVLVLAGLVIWNRLAPDPTPADGSNTQVVDGGPNVPQSDPPAPTVTQPRPPIPQEPTARVRIRYRVESLPEVPGEDAAKLFSNALGSWQDVVETPMRRADTRDAANVIVQAQAGSGTVAHVGPPRPDAPALIITFETNQAWTRKTFEALSCRMIGHVLGLTASRTPGQIMSDVSTGVTYETLPLVPQKEDIERARRIWDGVR